MENLENKNHTSPISQGQIALLYISFLLCYICKYIYIYMCVCVYIYISHIIGFILYMLCCSLFWIQHYNHEVFVHLTEKNL